MTNPIHGREDDRADAAERGATPAPSPLGGRGVPSARPLLVIGLVLAAGTAACVVEISALLRRPPNVVAREVPRVVVRGAIQHIAPESGEHGVETSGSAIAAASAPVARRGSNAPAPGPQTPNRSAPQPGLDLHEAATSMAGPAAGGGNDARLSPSDVSRIVALRTPALRRSCYDRGKSGGTVTVHATVRVGPSGTVQHVTTAGSDPTAARCVADQVGRWSFPPQGGVTTVEIPFRFVEQ